MFDSLTESDRLLMTTAERRHSAIVSLGTVIGLSLGLAFAYCRRRSAHQLYQTFLAKETPSSAKFYDGRETFLPDITASSYFKPTTTGAVATYVGLGIGGLIIGGGIAMALGCKVRERTIYGDAEAAKRIEYINFNMAIEVLKKLIDVVEGVKESRGLLGLPPDEKV